jgi:hypothetical protein
MTARLGLEQGDKVFHIGGVRPYAHAPRTLCAILGMQNALNRIGWGHFFSILTFQNRARRSRAAPAAYRKRLGVERMTGSQG